MKTKLNKIDKLVKKMLLGYPTLFKHRFDVMSHILTCNGNGFEWVNGELQYKDCCKTKQRNGLAELMKEVEKHQGELNGLKGDVRGYMSPLYAKFLVDAQSKVAYHQFVVDNIDVYASTYCGSDYNDHWLFLYKEAHDDGMGWWPINPSPESSLMTSLKIEDISPEWREAIKGWISEILPSMNGLIAVWDEKKRKFIGQKGYEKFVSFMYGLYEFYHSHPKDMELEKKRDAVASEIIDKILAEEKVGK